MKLCQRYISISISRHSIAKAVDVRLTITADLVVQRWMNWLTNGRKEKTHGPLTRYEKSRVARAPAMPGTFSRNRLQRKRLVNDPGMHHGTCVTQVPWCMSGSLTRGFGENVPGIPGACATRNFTYLARGTLAITSFRSNMTVWVTIRDEGK